MGSKGSKKVTVGYRYFWDVQAGLGRGAVNEIVAISADKKRVWIGEPGQVSQNTTIYIDKPNLFGGEDAGGEGGIRGYLEVAMGERDQLPTQRLRNLLKGTVPAFRGLVTTLFSGMISAYSSSPKPWSYRVRRTTKGWDNGDCWYPEKCSILLRDNVSDVGNFTDEANSRYPMPQAPRRTEGMTDAQWAIIMANYNNAVELVNQQRDTLRASLEENSRNIYAMNPAHILVECATNRDWGRGLSFGDIDLTSFKYAADYLFNEGFGLCFRYNRQDSLDTFVQQILDHIGAAQYADLSTGKLTLKLIRDDYKPEDLPLFNYDNGILSVQDDDSVGIDTAPNEITVKYKNPVSNKEAEVRAQNLGSIQAVGLISSSTDYRAIPTHDLAARVAQRDLEMSSAGIAKLTIIFDRRGGELMPAGCFRVSLPDRSIDNMVMRVGKIDENQNGSIIITAVQDVFGMPSTVYSGGDQPSEWTPPDTAVYAVSNVQLIELPYYLLVSMLSPADLDYLQEISGYLGVLASAPSSLSINYELQTRAQGAEFETRRIGDWIAFIELTEPLDKLGTFINFSSEFSAKVNDGLLINNEILRIDAIDPVNGIITISRGCADTLPAEHNTGSIAWLINSTIESDLIEYIASEIVEAKLLTQTRDEILEASIAPIEQVQMTGRQIRPYLPGRIAINNVLYPDVITKADNYRLTFAHRDRVLQSDRLIDCLEASIGAEPDVEYVIEINHELGGNVWREKITTTSIVLPYSTSSSSENAIHNVVVYSVRNEIESLYRFSAQLPRGHYDWWLA